MFSEGFVNRCNGKRNIMKAFEFIAKPSVTKLSGLTHLQNQLFQFWRNLNCWSGVRSPTRCFQAINATTFVTIQPFSQGGA